jgi:hypothetical protein
MSVKLAAVVAAVATTLETSTAFLVRVVSWGLPRLAPIPATDKQGRPNADAGTVPVTLHQSYAMRLNGAVLGEVVSFPGPLALYTEAVARGEIAAVAVPTYQTRPVLQEDGVWSPAGTVAGTVRVPSFIEAVNLAAASGAIVAYGWGRGRRITLPGKMSARKARGTTANVAAALAQIPK